ncbi:MAG: transporter substrate-binding domain-containing protein [Alphaproteobacteria bacterium]|nr:transporter substrate-binding domain-containing protein [Alphaproteobacteria bacterium]
MKLNAFFLVLLCCLVSFSATAADAGLRYIKTRGKVICGTDTATKTFAFTDKEKIRRGIDADICRMFALAIFGDSENFALKNVPTNKIHQALANNKIDIMLGNTSISAQTEISTNISPIDVLYYDKQVFAINTPDVMPSSMEEFRGQKVCVLQNSPYEETLRAYNHRFGLELKILPFISATAVREAFYLNRCELVSGSQIYLRGLATSPVAKNTKISILPEEISVLPIYAYIDYANPTLKTIAKWIINAPKLAEANEISSKNIDSVIGVRDSSVANLLGIDDKLWKKFELQPLWAKKYIKDYGNYGEIFERNIGKDSPLQIERDKNYLWDRGGMIVAQPFI